MNAGHDTSRVDSAYNWMFAEIAGFKLRTGEQLSENKLAIQLGISRTPVREALQRLEKEGLVKRTNNARFTVSQLSVREVNEACDLLEVLDTYIFRTAASKMTDADAERLLDSVAAMVVAAERGDRSAWSEADLDFHRTVNRVAGNQLVADTVKQTRRRIQRFWLRTASMQHRLPSCSDEHRVLAEAMMAKDYAAIGPEVEQHISHMRQSVVELLESAALFMGD